MNSPCEESRGVESQESKVESQKFNVRARKGIGAWTGDHLGNSI